jgi:hypothetical protein
VKTKTKTTARRIIDVTAYPADGQWLGAMKASCPNPSCHGSQHVHVLEPVMLNKPEVGQVYRAYRCGGYDLQVAEVRVPNDVAVIIVDKL